jgi:hypothetical protein
LYEREDAHARRYSLEGGVANVDIDGKNALSIKAIGAVISTFETLPNAENLSI